MWVTSPSAALSLPLPPRAQELCGWQQDAHPARDPHEVPQSQGKRCPGFLFELSEQGAAPTWIIQLRTIIFLEKPPRAATLHDTFCPHRLRVTPPGPKGLVEALKREGLPTLRVMRRELGTS